MPSMPGIRPDLFTALQLEALASAAGHNISPSIVTDVLIAYSRNSCIHFDKILTVLESSMSDDNKQPGVFAGSWRLAIIMLVILAAVWILGRAFA